MGGTLARIAIVTGSDSGIGRATVVTLAGDGCDVGVTWQTDEAGARAAAEEVRAAGRAAVVRRLDVTDPAAARAVIDDLVTELGGLDVFVNHAAVGGADAPFLQLDVALWRRVLDVDLTGAFVCAQRAAQHLVRIGRGGRIINVTSVHEHVPLYGASAYCAAKGGLGLLTKVMALELAEHGITVNAVAPGEVATAMSGQAPGRGYGHGHPVTGQDDADLRAGPRSGIPLGRPADAREIARAIAFLASPQASYATGASFVIDGGLLLTAPRR